MINRKTWNNKKCLVCPQYNYTPIKTAYVQPTTNSTILRAQYIKIYSK